MIKNNIKYNYRFKYLDSKGKQIRPLVPCTRRESIESAKSCLEEYGAYRVIKIKEAC